MIYRTRPLNKSDILGIYRSNMETDRLKYFTIIAETGSLTKAAAILGISHSGLSKAISALEVETKIKLFRPQGRGLEITPEGKRFYLKAQEILKILNEISTGQGHTKLPIRIGLSGVIAMTCAGLIAKELSGPISLAEIDIGEVEGKIISGDLDFGISFIPVPKPELEYLELGTVTLNSYVREDLLKSGPVEELPYAIPITDYPLNPLGYKNRDGWPTDVRRRPRFAVNSFSIALDLLRAGQSAIYMPDFAAKLENAKGGAHKFVMVKEHKAAQTKRKVYLVKRHTDEETKEMKKLAAFVRRTCC